MKIYEYLEQIDLDALVSSGVAKYTSMRDLSIYKYYRFLREHEKLPSMDARRRVSSTKYISISIVHDIIRRMESDLVK